MPDKQYEWYINWHFSQLHLDINWFNGMDLLKKIIYSFILFILVHLHIMKQEGLNHDQITDFNVCVTIVKTSVEHKKS